MIVVRVAITVAIITAIALGHRWALVVFCALVTLALEALTLMLIGLMRQINALEKRTSPKQSTEAEAAIRRRAERLAVASADPRKPTH